MINAHIGLLLIGWNMKIMSVYKMVVHGMAKGNM